ncbi:MAG: hypothetical protein U1E65_10040 [Myxococcota bacterium]
MSSELNPFETPKTSPLKSPASSELGVWRVGKNLKFGKGAPLPERCVKCNARMDRKVKRSLYYHHWAIYLLLLFNPLIYLVVALIVRKSARVEVPLCAQHAGRARLGMWLGALCLLTLFGGFGVAASVDAPALIALVFVAFFAQLVAAIILANVLRPVRIDKDFVEARGCGEAFLVTLPEWGGL